MGIETLADFLSPDLFWQRRLRVPGSEVTTVTGIEGRDVVEEVVTTVKEIRRQAPDCSSWDKSCPTPA